MLSVPIGAALWAEPTAFLAAEQADRDLQLDLFEHQRVKVDLIVLKDGEIKVSLPEFDLPGPVLKLLGRCVEQIEVDLERETDLYQAPIAQPLNSAAQRSSQAKIVADAIDSTLDDWIGRQGQIRCPRIELSRTVNVFKDQSIRRKSDQ